MAQTLQLVAGDVLRGHTAAIWWGAWATMDGRPILATGDDDGAVRLWDPIAAAPLGPPLTGHTDAVRWGAWATVDKRPILAAGRSDGAVRLWDPIAAAPLGPPLTGHIDAVRWGAWATLNGRLVLATGGDDGSVRLWDPVAAAPVGRPLTGHTDRVRWGEWATVDGRLVLATGTDDGTVRMWDPVAGALVGRPLTGHTGWVWWGKWATVEGRPILATGGDDGKVRLWDRGAPLGSPLTGHTGSIRWGAWATLDERPVLATGGQDGTVRLWDPVAAAQLGPPLTGHTDSVWWGKWATVDGRPILATGGQDMTVRLWEVQDVRVEARRRIGYRSDDGAARDELERTAEAASLAELVLARSARPPLAVGVFGDWGSGKTVFLRLLEEQVQLAAGRHDGVSHEAVRQVRFNAWHYAETDLWASLVAEIFSQLAAPPEGDRDVDAGTLQRQRSRLAAELAAQRKLAQRLAAARSRRDTLRRVREGRRWRVLSTEQREELTAAVEAVDPSLAADGGALYGAASGALPWLRVQLLQWRRVWSTLPWWAWFALALTVAGAFGIGIQQWPLISSLLGGAGLFGLVGAFAVARTAVGEVRASISTAVEAIKRIAEGQRSQVDTAVAVAEREVVELERQLQDLTAAGALAALASDRATEGGYRRNLGLMTQIREDFQLMGALLARAEQGRQARRTAAADRTDAPRDEARAGGGDLDAAGDALPRIDRIVLYIDDLDRCPPGRVVEVLEAIHLLLAVPLFVVVVAVDPRWLHQAVDVHYREMLHPESQPPGRSEGTEGPVDPNDPQLWASTPAQYLEKIFQIVFTLPSVSTAGYTRMLDELTSTRVDQPDPPVDVPEPPVAPARPDDNGHPADGGVDPATDPEIGWDSAVELPAAPVLVRVDPYALRQDERTLMRLLGPPLITTPRAVKRLTNSYGLLAAIQRQTPISARDPNLESDSARSGDAAVDRPAMVLLAALIGFAALGPALFTHLHHSAAQNPHETWTAFLLRLNPRFENGRWASPATPDMTTAEAQSWRTLLRALHDITHNAAAARLPLPEPVEAWARWIVPVGRLSFPTGRIVSSLIPPATPTRTDSRWPAAPATFARTEEPPT